MPRRWTGPSSSRVNRDRRDSAFASGIIGEAERRRRAEVALDDDERPEPDRCAWFKCGRLLSGNAEVRDEHWPYCSAMCAIRAEQD